MTHTEVLVRVTFMKKTFTHVRSVKPGISELLPVPGPGFYFDQCKF